MTTAVPARPPARWATWVLHLTVIGCLIALQLQLAPHEYLEEIDLLQFWRATGFDGFLDSVARRPGRILNLVPLYVGYLAPGDGYLGMWAVLTATVVATYAAAVWAARPLVASPIIRSVLGLTVALHPLWTGGWILRFVPASTSGLGLVVWAGCTVRYALGRSTAWLVGGSACLAVGLLHYPGAAAVPVLWLGVLGAAERADRRWSWSAGRWWRSALAATATIFAVLAYVSVIAPRLSDEAYESEVTDYSPTTLRASAQRLFEVCTHDRAFLLVYLLVVMGSVAFTVTTWRRAGGKWSAVVLAGAIATPAVAVTYAGNPAFSGDPERVLFPIGLALTGLGWVVLPRVVPSPRRTLALAAVAAASVGAAVGAVVTWDEIGDRNERVLRPIVEIVDGLPRDSTLVVADGTGRIGDEYTFLPPHLAFAVAVELGRPVDLTLCTPASVERHHRYAERLGIPTTPDCDAVIAGRPTTVAGTLDFDDGAVEVLVVAPTSIAPIP